MTESTPSQLPIGERVVLQDPVVGQNEQYPRQYACPTFFQVSPTQVVLIANRRVTKIPVVDHEDGWDSFVFDDLAQLTESLAQSGNYQQHDVHPLTGEQLVMVHHLPTGGFVPLGAKLADGRNHPHAGTGFGLDGVIGHPADHSNPVPLHGSVPNHQYRLRMQYKFDGQTFQVIDKQRIDPSAKVLGWRITSRGFGPAVPDGEDLLYTMTALREDEHVEAYLKRLQDLGRTSNLSAGACSGPVLTRWRKGSDGWQIVEINRIVEPGPDNSFEPSLVRDQDGSLLCSVRSKGTDGAAPGERDATGMENLYQAFRVYRSTDNGKTWKRHLCVPVVRSATPVTINRFGDGQVFLAANPTLPLEIDSKGRKVPMHSQRQRLWIWPLSDDRRDIGEPICVLDAVKEFGPARPLDCHVCDNGWNVDHPLCVPVRLGDGKWHNLLAFRVIDRAINSGGASAAPEGGLYIMTVPGKMRPPYPWRFA